MSSSPITPANPGRTRRRWRPLRVATVAAVGLAPALLAPGIASAAPTSPPPVTISTPGAANSNGDFFLTPTGGTATYANGPEILDPQGNVIWFHPIPVGQTATDFRTQTYQGQPVLTWWQGVGSGGVGVGTDYIYDQNYQPLATVNAGNGYSADSHEFQLTPQGTALITVNTTTTADLTSIGGNANQKVTDGLIQEIDVATGAVLFQWDAAAHIPYSDSHTPLPASASTAWDWFHINAAHLDTDGNLLIDARNTWTTYKVNHTTGAVIWELGGKSSTFSLLTAPGQVLDANNEIFAYQHDPENVGPNRYTIFDDDGPGLPTSRAVTIQLDLVADTATLVSSDYQPQGLSASSQGDAQTAANGDLVVGWGNLNHFSEFDPAGNLVLDAAFPTGVNTYRAYRLPWAGAAVPALPEAGWALALPLTGVAAAGVLLAGRRRRAHRTA